MIEIVDFCKSYKNSFKLSDVNFAVKPGEITVLLGANGSGKSTLMKAICGIHYGDSGKILLSGNSDESTLSADESTGSSASVSGKINVEENPEKAMELTGFVPEVSLLPQNMIVADFLTYVARVHGLDESQTEKAMKRVIKDCALEEILLKKIKLLSKGLKQRVSFAQALIHNPENLVLDEPVSGLDPVQIVHMRKLIQKLSEKKSILISTHILQECQELNAKIVIFSKGRQVAAGTEKEILLQTGCKSIENLLLKEEGL